MTRSKRIQQALFVSAIVVTLVGVRTAAAQGEHPIAVGVNYTYVHTNLLPGCNCFGMNGAGAQLEYGLRPRLAALGDFTATHRGGITADSYSLTQLTFMGGVRYRPALGFHRVQTFGDLLVGAAHASGSLSPASTGFGGSTAFAFQTGGGLELHLNRRFTIVPVQAEYLLTTFANGAANRQNDLRLSGGVLIRLSR